VPCAHQLLERLHRRSGGRKLTLALLDGGVTEVAQLLPGLVAQLPRGIQRHFGVKTEHQPLFPVSKPVLHSPGLRALARHVEVQPAGICKLVIPLGGLGFPHLEVCQHECPHLSNRCPQKRPVQHGIWGHPKGLNERTG
jgi:hypothetical protein